MAAELDARVEQADGDIAVVRHELEDKLDAMEVGGQQVDQVQIALLLAEISYLDELARKLKQNVPEKHTGLLEQVRRLFSGHS
jgi:hypothetical protein